MKVVFVKSIVRKARRKRKRPFHQAREDGEKCIQIKIGAGWTHGFLFRGYCAEPLNLGQTTLRAAADDHQSVKFKLNTTARSRVTFAVAAMYSSQTNRAGEDTERYSYV